jgi:GNAT superfamily N-acetyltransferase
VTIAIDIHAAPVAADLRRFCEVGSMLCRNGAHPGARTVEQTHALLGPDNPTAASCDVALITAFGGAACAAAIVNPRLVDADGAPIGLIGFFDSFDDHEATSAVLDAACDYLRTRGCASARGPLNFTTFHDYRFVVRDEAPGVWVPGEPYHRGYYPRLWSESGFSIAANYSTNWIPDAQSNIDRMAPGAEKFASNGLRIRTLAGPSDFAALYGLTCAGFADAWMYSPIEPAEFAAIYTPDRVASSAAGAYLAVTPDDEPIGFFYTTTAVSDEPGEIAVAKTIAVRRDYRNQGVYHALFRNWFVERQAAGCEKYIAALIHIDGAPAGMGWHTGPVVRKYAVYERGL